MRPTALTPSIYWKFSVNMRFMIVITQLPVTKAIEFWNVNMLHERKLFSRSRRSEQSFVSAYHLYFVSTDNICVRICGILCFISENVYYWLFVRVICGRSIGTSAFTCHSITCRTAEDAGERTDDNNCTTYVTNYYSSHWILSGYYAGNLTESTCLAMYWNIYTITRPKIWKPSKFFHTFTHGSYKQNRLFEHQGLLCLYSCQFAWEDTDCIAQGFP
jgi:hypothetical protein